MIPNDDMPPRHPDEDEPLKDEAGDILDFIDKTVAQITDADVDEHLRNVLDQAGYSREQHTGPPMMRVIASEDAGTPVQIRDSHGGKTTFVLYDDTERRLWALDAIPELERVNIIMSLRDVRARYRDGVQGNRDRGIA
jgi:hypothetical protein